MIHIVYQLKLRGLIGFCSTLCIVAGKFSNEKTAFRRLKSGTLLMKIFRKLTQSNYNYEKDFHYSACCFYSDPIF